MTPEQITSAQEKINSLKQETPEDVQERAAQRNVKHAFWDFQAEGGTSVQEFIGSDYFKKAQDAHIAFFKTEHGISNAVNFLTLKYSSAPKGGSDIVRQMGANDEKHAVDVIIDPFRISGSEGSFIVVPESVSSDSSRKGSPSTLLENSEGVTMLTINSENQTAQNTLTAEQELTHLDSNEKSEQLLQQSPPTNQVETLPVSQMTQQLEEEQKLERVEAVRRLTLGYRAFFDGLRKYNEYTLDRDGRETSESIFYKSDIDQIINELDEASHLESEESINKAVSLVTKVAQFMHANSFPVKGGMQVSSIEGYDLALDLAKDFIKALKEFYVSLSVDQKKDIGSNVESLYNFVNEIGGLMEKKREYTDSYLSR